MLVIEAPIRRRQVSYPESPAWEEKDDVVRLLASRCTHCSQLAFPPTDECARCGRAEDGDRQSVSLSGLGRLYTYSVIHVAPASFRPPYAVGYVDLPEGIRVLAQIELPEGGLEIGETLQASLGVIRRTEDEDVLSYVFCRPEAEWVVR
jgi:uncharacterized OB-fold protein